MGAQQAISRIGPLRQTGLLHSPARTSNDTTDAYLGQEMDLFGEIGKVGAKFTPAVALTDYLYDLVMTCFDELIEQ